jgi:hypothetical protein
MISSQIPIISSLVKGAREIKVVQSAEDVPAGCGTEPIAVNLAVHILVKGRINASDEISKLEKKTALAQAGQEKLAKLAGQPNYETAIPSEVRAKNAEKVIVLRYTVWTALIPLPRPESLTPRSKPCDWRLRGSKLWLRRSSQNCIPWIRMNRIVPCEVEIDTAVPSTRQPPIKAITEVLYAASPGFRFSLFAWGRVFMSHDIEPRLEKYVRARAETLLPPHKSSRP